MDIDTIMTWKNTDPRHEVTKSANIAVYIPGASLLTQGHVECKHGYYVLLDHLPPRGHIEGQTVESTDTWPESWWWIQLPLQ